MFAGLVPAESAKMRDFAQYVGFCRTDVRQNERLRSGSVIFVDIIRGSTPGVKGLLF